MNKAMGRSKLGNYFSKKKTDKRTQENFTFFLKTTTNKPTYPTMWKRSEICPIYKNGDKPSVIRYRSISLLFLVSKRLKGLFFDEMSIHIFTFSNSNTKASMVFDQKDRKQFKC